MTKNPEHFIFENIFQNHLQQKVLDGFQCFQIHSEAEIVRSHEHLESFNSSDSSLRYLVKASVAKKTLSFLLLNKNKTISSRAQAFRFRSIHFASFSFIAQLHNVESARQTPPDPAKNMSAYTQSSCLRKYHFGWDAQAGHPILQNSGLPYYPTPVSSH